MQQMIRNGVDTATAEKTIQDQTVQDYLVYFDDLQQAYNSGKLSTKDFGYKVLEGLGYVNKYLESLPYQDETAAVGFALQLAAGGSLKVAVSAGLGLLVADAVKEFKEKVADELVARIVYGVGSEEHFAQSVIKDRDEMLFFDHMSGGAELGLEIIFGAVGSITKTVIKNSNIKELDFTLDDKQIMRKYKHADAFGVTDNNNTVGRSKFKEAIISHINDKDTYEYGTYIHENNSRVFYNKSTNRVVITTQSGEFISGWQLDPGSLQYNNYIKNGALR